MISQFFEVQVKEGQIDRSLDLAASLKPSLEAMGGCLFIDRLKSLNRKNLLLSYQTWQDEGSMIAWRVDASHHTVQETGRESWCSETEKTALSGYTVTCPTVIGMPQFGTRNTFGTNPRLLLHRRNSGAPVLGQISKREHGVAADRLCAPAAGVLAPAGIG